MHQTQYWLHWPHVVTKNMSVRIGKYLIYSVKISKSFSSRHIFSIHNTGSNVVRVKLHILLYNIIISLTEMRNYVMWKWFSTILCDLCAQLAMFIWALIDKSVIGESVIKFAEQSSYVWVLPFIPPSNLLIFPLLVSNIVIFPPCSMLRKYS